MRITRRAAVDISLLILVNTMWAAQYAAYRVATEKMGPVTVSAWAFLLASLVLLPFLGWERRAAQRLGVGRAVSGGHPQEASRSRWSARSVFGFLMISILGLIPGSMLLAWGVARSTASNAAIIYLTMPVMTALLASVILGEKMNYLRWGSLGISLVGVLILSAADLRQLQLSRGRFLLGNVLVLLACLGSSFYNVYCKELLKRFTLLEVLIYGYTLAFLASMLLLPWAEPLSLSSLHAYSAATWAALVTLSVFSWGLAMVLWMFLLKRLDVSQASVSIYLLPFLGVLISALTLKEQITPVMILGGLVTLAGTVLITSLEPTSA
jgi:drug/metabolite transporter (DMT)-like permease